MSFHVVLEGSWIAVDAICEGQERIRSFGTFATVVVAAFRLLFFQVSRIKLEIDPLIDIGQLRPSSNLRQSSTKSPKCPSKLWLPGDRFSLPSLAVVACNFHHVADLGLPDADANFEVLRYILSGKLIR